ncbi:MAG: CoA pyrophosphatase [Gemmatimonadetes bacterium]|nr:CoA pyrophosphatase [Gemmatimonadota bacterium]
MSALLDRLFAELAQQPPVRVDLPEHPHAAVALLLAPDPDRLLLIRRAERVGDPWSGQLALPGGRREAHDVDLLHTAIRETAEETGLHLDRQWHRADLDDLAPMTPVLPPIVVRPFAFQLAEALAAGLSAEVAGVAWVPLATLAAPEAYRDAEIDVRGVPRIVRGYHLEDGLLWGMTERIVTPVVARWRKLSGR